MNYVGYISSDPVSSGYIPHNVQNYTIKNFLAKKNHHFMLSWTEFKNHSLLAFNSLCEENYFEGICFFSWEQLKALENISEKLHALIERRLCLAFAREGLIVETAAELDSFLENYFLSFCINQTPDLRIWLDERNKYI